MVLQKERRKVCLVVAAEPQNSQEFVLAWAPSCCPVCHECPRRAERNTPLRPRVLPQAEIQANEGSRGEG